MLFTSHTVENTPIDTPIRMTKNGIKQISWMHTNQIALKIVNQHQGPINRQTLL